MSDQDLEKVDSGRRDFLKKSLAAGAVVWGAPAVTSLPGGRAWAQTYEQCLCNADAFGLRVIVPLLGFDQTFGVDGSVINTGTIPLPVGSVAATVVTGNDSSSVDGACGGAASIATLDLIVGTAIAPQLRVTVGVLTSFARANCDPCGTFGNATIANASASGSLLGGGSIDLDAIAACNTDVLSLGIIVINEQTCDADGTLNVNALHITVPGIVEVIAAHSEAGATNCPCTPCAPAP